MNSRLPTNTLVIFGGSGDITKRKIIPALHSLYCDELLPDDLAIIGMGRTEYEPNEYWEHLKPGVQEYGRFQPKTWEDFAKKIDYLSGGYDSQATYEELSDRIGENAVFYTAVPPSLFPVITEQLGAAGLQASDSGWRRIVVEKPFGRDQESARQLNQTLHSVFREDQIFRIDHFLGKETVQNILTFRFANVIFEPLWNINYIDHVQILVTEDFGIRERGEYYDQAGILRDMFQNHMMQLLTFIAIEPPPIWDAAALRDEKVKLLQAVRPIDRSLRGQYQGYLEETDVKQDSKTSTFGAIRMFIDNWRWRDVPFYILSGKQLKAKSTSIKIHFKTVPHLLFAPSQREKIAPNVLSLCLQPNESMRLGIQAKKPGEDMDTRSITIDYNYAQDYDQQALPDAYERLLVDVFEGDASLFARADEIELSWGIIDPVIEAWQDQSIPLHRYQPGSWGPDAVHDFIQQDGRQWDYSCIR